MPWPSRASASGRVTVPVLAGSWSRLSLTVLPGAIRSGSIRSLMKRRRVSMWTQCPDRPPADHRDRPARRGHAGDTGTRGATRVTGITVVTGIARGGPHQRRNRGATHPLQARRAALGFDQPAPDAV